MFHDSHVEDTNLHDNANDNLDEIDAGMALAWQLSGPAPAGCKTISQLRKGE